MIGLSPGSVRTRVTITAGDRLHVAGSFDDPGSMVGSPPGLRFECRHGQAQRNRRHRNALAGTLHAARHQEGRAADQQHPQEIQCHQLAERTS